MRPPRPRLTVRRLMILVAVAGLAVGAVLEYGRLRTLSHQHGIRAARMGGQEALARREATRSDAEYRAALQDAEKNQWDPGLPWRTRKPRSPERSRRDAAFYASLRSKYERAARLPWLPVAPDPPYPGPE